MLNTSAQPMLMKYSRRLQLDRTVESPPPIPRLRSAQGKLRNGLVACPWAMSVSVRKDEIDNDSTNRKDEGE